MENIKIINNLNLNKFFNDIKLKKQYIKKLKSKVDLLNNVKKNNYKSLNLLISNLSNNKINFFKENFLITHIIDITFSRTNTLLSVMDFSGRIKYFCSAGYLQYKGKKKKSRYVVFQKMCKILFSRLEFLKSQPLALNLKNVRWSKFWILKSLKKKLFIKIVKNYDLCPHNGCRKRKIKRK